MAPQYTDEQVIEYERLEAQGVYSYMKVPSS